MDTEGRTSVHFKNVLSSGKILMLEIWGFYVLYVKKLPTPPPLFQNEEMSEWFTDLSQVTSHFSVREMTKISGHMMSQLCDLFIGIGHCFPISWAWTDPGICYCCHLHFFLSQGSTQGGHSRPLAPPSSTSPSILGLPTVTSSPPWRFWFWWLLQAGWRGCLPLAPTPQPSVPLFDFHHGWHTWWQPSERQTRIWCPWPSFPSFFPFCCVLASVVHLILVSQPVSLSAEVDADGVRGNNASPLPHYKERWLLRLFKHK